MSNIEIETIHTEPYTAIKENGITLAIVQGDTFYARPHCLDRGIPIDDLAAIIETVRRTNRKGDTS